MQHQTNSAEGAIQSGALHVESRFQRLSMVHPESWGDAPGLCEAAPLALNTYERGALEPPSRIERKAHFQSHLPVIHLAIFNMAARFRNFKPTHVANRLFSPRQSVLYRRFKPIRRGTD